MLKFINCLLIICLLKCNFGLNIEIIKEFNENLTQFDDYMQDLQEVNDNDKCTLNKLMDSMEKYIPDKIETKKDMKIHKTTKNMNQSIAIVKNLIHLFQSNTDNNVMKRLTQRISELILTTDLSPECMSTIVRIGESARNMEGWALKFIDSQIKWTSGMLEMSGFPIGEYDECLAIRSPQSEDKSLIIGQYCSVGRFELLPDPNSYEEGDPIDQHFLIMIEEYLNRTYNGTVDWKTPKMFIGSNGKLKLNEKIIKEVLVANDYFRDFISKVPTGICLPSTCHPIEIQNAINKFLYPATLFTMAINPDCDYIGKAHKWNSYQLISIRYWIEGIFWVIIILTFDTFVDSINSCALEYILKLVITFNYFYNKIIMNQSHYFV